MALSAPPSGAGTGAMSPPAPMMGGASPPPPTGPDAGSDDSDVIVTICKASDGGSGYVVYAGDEPDPDADDAGSPDMSTDDANAMGPAGDVPAGGAGAGSGAGGGPPGQPASSLGEALQLALKIMQADAASAGAPGSEDDQFASGFSADKSPKMAPSKPSPALKY